MTRIILNQEQLQSKKVTITGEQARHLSLVLRVHSGEQVIIFDGQGYKYNCRILRAHKKEVTAEVIDKSPYSAESPISVTLAQGLPKGEKMNLIIQKSTELGVHRIIPLVTGRSQIRHTEKIERWRKIALSASQQSARDKIPEIDRPVDFREFLSALPQAGGNEEVHGIIFAEEHKETNLKQVLGSFHTIQHLTLLIGPEGGFSEEEVSAAAKKGFIEASLGPRILRTETAPITALSIVQYELGDMGGR